MFATAARHTIICAKNTVNSSAEMDSPDASNRPKLISVTVGMRRQSENRLVEVQFDIGVEGGYDDFVAGLPCMEAAAFLVCNELVALDAATSLVVPGHNQPSRESGI